MRTKSQNSPCLQKTTPELSAIFTIPVPIYPSLAHGACDPLSKLSAFWAPRHQGIEFLAGSWPPRAGQFPAARHAGILDACHSRLMLFCCTFESCRHFFFFGLAPDSLHVHTNKLDSRVPGAIIGIYYYVRAVQASFLSSLLVTHTHTHTNTHTHTWCVCVCTRMWGSSIRRGTQEVPLRFPFHAHIWLAGLCDRRPTPRRCCMTRETPTWTENAREKRKIRKIAPSHARRIGKEYLRAHTSFDLCRLRAASHTRFLCIRVGIWCLCFALFVIVGTEK